MGYDQYTVPDSVVVKTSFIAFLWHAQTYVHGLLCHSFKFLWRTANSKPPTIPFVIVACTFCDNLSRNSCILKQWIVFFLALIGYSISAYPTLFTDSPQVPLSERRQTRVSCEQNAFPVSCRNKQRNFTTNQASCSRNRRRWRSSVWKF